MRLSKHIHIKISYLKEIKIFYFVFWKKKKKGFILQKGNKWSYLSQPHSRQQCSFSDYNNERIRVILLKWKSYLMFKGMTFHIQSQVLVEQVEDSVCSRKITKALIKGFLAYDISKTVFQSRTQSFKMFPLIMSESKHVKCYWLSFQTRDEPCVVVFAKVIHKIFFKCC